ncbi:Uncharacterised protein [Streptococcus suis]|uniref:Uncharacterized protein n=1 Tax=Streptococcus suis TaxID=1307 RepID=A0A0Z8M1Q3_STRSU|nr:Uncharacterised protein [Streptococcus suis]CYW00813.1 Uncharacterised protein [Streptococcus suis]
MKKFFKFCFVILGLVVIANSLIFIKPKSKGIDPGVVHVFK